MNGQLVDLFDRKRFGINYWAAIALFLGMLLAVAFNVLQSAYEILVEGRQFVTADGEPLTLMADAAMRLRYFTPWGIGVAASVTVAPAVVRKDLYVPPIAGVLMAVWGVFVRLVGLVPAAAFDPGAVASDFAWGFLTLGCIVVLYHLLRNKLMAMAFGMALASVLMALSLPLRYETPFSFALGTAAEELSAGFVQGVFLFAGIALGLAGKGVLLVEHGMVEAPHDASEEGSGKVRRPLITLFLLLVTVNLYWLGWIYRTYGEIRSRLPDATKVTPGKALGLMFVPVFNFFWALWLFLDHPRAIARLQERDEPAGVPARRWAITACLVGCMVAGIIGSWVWTPALYLNVVFLWAAVLLAQSALNSHWLAHRGRTGGVATG